MPNNEDFICTICGEEVTFRQVMRYQPFSKSDLLNATISGDYSDLNMPSMDPEFHFEIAQKCECDIPTLQQDEVDLLTGLGEVFTVIIKRSKK